MKLLDPKSHIPLTEPRVSQARKDGRYTDKYNILKKKRHLQIKSHFIIFHFHLLNFLRWAPKRRKLVF